MQQEVPQELIELLDVVKLQNEKIFEMQEEQILWNKQHASNLKNILSKLSDIYDTIKRFKDSKTSFAQQTQLVYHQSYLFHQVPNFSIYIFPV